MKKKLSIEKETNKKKERKLTRLTKKQTSRDMEK